LIPCDNFYIKEFGDCDLFYVVSKEPLLREVNHEIVCECQSKAHAKLVAAVLNDGTNDISLDLFREES
jgi:hypothetical protein